MASIALGSGKEICNWLEKIGIDPSMSRRTIIDIPHDGAVIVYEERYGDNRIFQIEPMAGIKIAVEKMKKRVGYNPPPSCCPDMPNPPPPPPRKVNAFGYEKKHSKLRLQKWYQGLKEFITYRSRFEDGGLK